MSKSLLSMTQEFYPRVGSLGCLGGLLVFFAVAVSTGPSKAAMLHPWCASGTVEDSGALSCSYDTYEQCVANVGICQANPAVQPLPQAQAYSTKSHKAR
jgi:hypothetical protein